MANTSFAFPAAASGRTVSVYDDSGDVVATDTLGTSEDFVVLEVDLPWGAFYEARTTGNGAVYRAQGEVQEIAAGGGGGGDTVSRGTLYLKASGTGIDVSGNEDGEWGVGGTELPYVLDTERQGDSPIPGWVTKVGDEWHITERGFYMTQIGAVGTLTFPDVPESVQFDIFDGGNVLNAGPGINHGWYSDGSDDSDPFTPAEVNDLALKPKDGWNNLIPDSTDFPVVLTGIGGDHFSTPSTADSVADLDVRVAITKLGAGPRYTDADFA